MISKWQTKCSGRPFAVCVELDLKPLFSSKIQMASFERSDPILNRWREYFGDLLNPVDVTPTQIHEEHVGEDI